jgi:addiction module HigA family antidote
MRIPTHREPTHPGEMLLEEFLLPMHISPADLAKAIHLPLQQINDLLNQNKPITPSMALRLAKFLGVSADYWLNLQMRCDLYQAQLAEKNELDAIEDFHFLQKLA